MIIIRQRNFSLISRGVRFIKELRTIDPLPISKEDYAIFLFHVDKAFKIFGNEIIDPERQRKISELLNKYYKSPKASDILGKVGRRFAQEILVDRSVKIIPIYDKTNNRDFSFAIDYSYDRMNHLPKRYIMDCLGCGGYGITFDYSKTKIEKVSYIGFTKNEYKFYEYLSKNYISIFPKVYTLEKDQVVMEKLLTNTPKVNEYKEYISKYIYKEERSNLRDPITRHVYWDKVEKELGKNHPFYKFLLNVKSGIKKIFNVDDIGDLTKSNIGERIGTGEIVYFDPIGGLIAME